jgi:hypothetical protein
MVRFKILKGFDVSWSGDIWLHEFPFSNCLSVIKKKGDAAEFYLDEETKIFKLLKSRNITFETVGESEHRPRASLK